MEPIQDRVIILRVIPFEERHQIIAALTESRGRISAMAKNSIQSRRFGASLSPFTVSKWQFTEKPGAELAHLTGSESVHTFPGLQADFDKLTLASIITELSLRLTPIHQESQEWFKLLFNALSAIEAAEIPRDSLLLLSSFILKALQCHGNQPQLMSCKDCHKMLTELENGERTIGVVESASWICSSCMADSKHTGVPLTALGLKHLLGWMHLPIRKVPESSDVEMDEQKALYAFVESLMIYHIPGFDRQPIKSLRFLNAESNLKPQEESPR